jgi:peptide/nickel transport system substrate-binding protein
MERIEAPDPQTVVIHWNRPFIGADGAFSEGGGTLAFGLPLPKHLLSEPYEMDRENFVQAPYWNSEWVGLGPFRVREYVRGSRVTLQAYDDYLLGRPKIDQIEIRFILDLNALAASVLAGEVEMTFGRSFSLEQALALKEQWREGRMELGWTQMINVFPQFTNPDPAVIGNVQFRRAMLHAIDRQEMVDSLNAGLSSIAHSPLGPDAPELKEIDPAIVRYEYDPRRAAGLIEGLGYSRGADGGYRDAANQRLSVEIRTGSQDYQSKPLFAIADYWQQLGLTVDRVVMAEQRSRDLEYRATYPGFELVQGSASMLRLSNLHSGGASLPETNWRWAGTGKNYARYINPQMDALVDRFFVTIPRPERMDIARQIFHQLTDQVIWLGIYYNSQPVMLSNRIQNVADRKTAEGLPGWNSQQWELR